MRSRLLRAFSLGFLLFLAACSCDSSSPFGTPSRTATLRVDVTDPNGTVTPVYASLSETKGDPYPRSLSVSVNDPAFGTPSPLAGHILHLRLLDGFLQVVQEIKTTTGNANTNSVLTETVFFAASETARYDAMRALFLSGKTMLEIDTDLPGREQIRLPLKIVGGTDWATPSCD